MSECNNCGCSSALIKACGGCPRRQTLPPRIQREPEPEPASGLIVAVLLVLAAWGLVAAWSVVV